MKRTLIFILFIASTLSLTAQPQLKQPEMYVGVHGGVMASLVQFTPSIEQDLLQTLGANGGLVFRYAGHKVCGLQVELNYMQRGWYEQKTGYRRTIDYIELPFLTHLSFGRSFRGFVNLGPQIGYAIREDHKNMPDLTANGEGQTANGAQYLPIDNRFDWGIAGGLGMLYRTKKAGVYQLEARFNYSFGDLFSNSKFATFSRSCPMNISINLGWLWDIKK